MQRQMLHSQSSSSSRRLAAGIFITLFAACCPSFVWSQVSWNFAGPREWPDRIRAVAADPKGVVYAAAPGGGIWKTTDFGATWTPRFETASSLQVCSVAVDPNNADVVYAGTGDDQSPRPLQGVARSSNGGVSWTFSVRFTNQPVCTLAINPVDSKQILAGSRDGIFLSTDSGGNWVKVFSLPVTSIAFGKDGLVYAGVLGSTSTARDRLLWRSSNGGRVWTSMSLPDHPNVSGADTDWVSVTIEPDAISILVSYNSTPLVAGDASTLDFYRSADSGVTWTSTFGFAESRPPVSVIHDAKSDSLYLIGSTLLNSANDGGSWNSVPTKGTGFHSVATVNGQLVLAGDDGIEAVSLSAGVAATVIPQLPGGRFLGVSFDPSDAIWAASPAGIVELFPFTNGKDLRVTGVDEAGDVASPSGTSNVFVSSHTQVFHSTDSGAHFTSRLVIPAAELRAPSPPLLPDPGNTATVYIAGQHLYRTSDSGANLTTLGTVDPDPTHVVIALAVAPASRLLFYAATSCLPDVSSTPCSPVSIVWRSTNGGDSWVQAGSVTGLVNRIAIDPRQPNTLYAAIGAFPGGASTTAGYISGDLLMSTSGGTNWTSVRSNLPDVPINAIVIDPTSLPAMLTQPAQRLYIGTDSGVFVTFNMAIQTSPTWTHLAGTVSHTLPASPVTDLALRSDGTLIAATFGRGVFWTSTTGIAPGVIVSRLSMSVTVRQQNSLMTGITLTNAAAAVTYGLHLGSYEPWMTIPQPNTEIRPGTVEEIGIRVSASGLQSGVYVGRLELISAGNVQNILVEARVAAAPAHLTVVGGNAQTAGTGGTQPVQVLISDASDLPVAGVPVTFAVTTGGGAVSNRTALTNALGIAATTLTLPPTPGVVGLAFTAGDLNATATVTAMSAPSLFSNSVIDGVAANPYTPLGPGSVISISGENLADGTASAAAPLPTLLRTTKVFITSGMSDVPLLLISVSPTLLRAMIPTTTSPGAYSLRVEVGSRRSNSVAVSVAPFAPAIFTVSGNGRGQGIFVKSDGSIVSAANPADRGSLVTFYAAGLGAVAGLNTVRTPRVFFDIYQAELISSGLAPNMPARDQIVVRVPAFVSPATNVSVSLSIGGYTSNRVTIPVR